MRTREEAYCVLELTQDASLEDARKAYKRLALKWHPDKNRNVKEATVKFQQISDAYKKIVEPPADDDDNYDEEEMGFGMSEDAMFEMFNHMMFSSMFGGPGITQLRDIFEETIADAYAWEVCGGPFYEHGANASSSDYSPEDSDVSSCDDNRTEDSSCVCHAYESECQTDKFDDIVEERKQSPGGEDKPHTTTPKCRELEIENWRIPTSYYEGPSGPPKPLSPARRVDATSRNFQDSREEINEKAKQNVDDRRVTTEQLEPEIHSGLDVGKHVIVRGQYTGVVLFHGPTQYARGDWVGVALDEPVGKNDGMVKGTRYFQCEPLHGLIVRPEEAKPIVA